MEFLLQSTVNKPTELPMREPSREYLDACDAHTRALHLYWSVRERYYAGLCSEEDFLKARTAKLEADRVYDKAYSKEWNRG